MKAKTRQVIALHVGDRNRMSAERLWAKIPGAYCQHATFYTNRYVVYERGDSRAVVPSDQQVGTQNQSHRTIQQYATTARVTLGTRCIVVFQEARQPYRCYQAAYLPLQPDESCSVERALHG